MNDIDQILIKITDTLKNEGVDKIILFGSYAYGRPKLEIFEKLFQLTCWFTQS